MRYCAIVTIVALLLVANINGGEQPTFKPRIWKDRDKNEVIEGWFDDIVGDHVTLVHTGGLRRIIELRELSQLDQMLIHEIMQARTVLFYHHLGGIIDLVEVEDITVVAGKPILVTREIPDHDRLLPETLEDVLKGLSRDLAGKTIRFSGRVTGTARPKGSSQRRIDFTVACPPLRLWFARPLVFRDQLFLPARLLENDDIQDGDTIILEGRFAPTIDPCRKCKGTKLIRCSYCSGGWTRVTVMEQRYTPDGAAFMFPTGVKVVCSRCDGNARLVCDHYVKPVNWNPFDPTDQYRSIIGQLFTRDLSRALSFRLQDMIITIVSQDKGSKLRISRPAGEAIKVEYR